MRPAAYLFTSLFAACITTSGWADVIYLRNQKYIKGVVKGQDLNSVIIKTRAGKNRRIPKRSIRKILYISAKRQLELDRIAARRARKRRLSRRKSTALRQKKARRLDEAEQKRLRAARRIQDRRIRRRIESERRNEIIAQERRSYALLRSAVLPGWGQHWMGEPVRGYLFFGTTLALGAALYSSANSFRRGRADYDEAVTIAYLGISDSQVAFLGLSRAIEARAIINSRGNQSRNLSFLILAVYVYNLFDAYYRRRTSDFETGFHLSMERSDGAVGEGINFYAGHGAPADQRIALSWEMSIR